MDKLTLPLGNLLQGLRIYVKKFQELCRMIRKYHNDVLCQLIDASLFLQTTANQRL